MNQSQNTKPLASVTPKAKATRHDLQLGRRLFHAINGVTIAGAYHYFFTHNDIISLVGTLACALYVFEQVRVNYPHIFKNIRWAMNFIMRAEEEEKESSMIPYAMAILLSILTFPKTMAILGILTLAIADPLSAIIGIRFGKHKIGPRKSVEGTLAFFIATLAVSFLVLYTGENDFWIRQFMACLLIAFLCGAFELIPLKIDDNLTIPLFVGFCAWIVCHAFNIPFIN